MSFSIPEAYSEDSQIYKIERFAKTVILTITVTITIINTFHKSPILDV